MIPFQFPEQTIWSIEEQKLRIFDQDGKVRAQANEPSQDCDHCSSSSCSEVCEYRILSQRMRLFNKAAIPSRFIHATMDSLRQQRHRTPSPPKVITWLDTWCQQDPLPERGLLLSGPHGSGKSFVMSAVIRWLTLNRGIPCLFVDFGLFLMQLKARYTSGQNDYDLFNQLFTVEVLILDDVGSSRDSEWSRDVFTTIIARRYNDCSKTFLTTNLSINDHEKRQEKSLLRWTGLHSGSRLKEMCYWLSFDGIDRRMLEK